MVAGEEKVSSIGLPWWNMLSVIVSLLLVSGASRIGDDGSVIFAVSEEEYVRNGEKQTWFL